MLLYLVNAFITKEMALALNNFPAWIPAFAGMTVYVLFGFAWPKGGDYRADGGYRLVPRH